MVVIYDNRRQLKVVFKLHGSVWPKVLPWCILNAGVAGALLFLKLHAKIDLSIAGGYGYQTMSVLVSFFVVNNINTTYNRYWEARGCLGKALNELMMLASRAALYTSGDSTPGAILWRSILRNRLIELVKTSMHAIQNERAMEVLGDIEKEEKKAKKAAKKAKKTKSSTIINEKQPIVQKTFRKHEDLPNTYTFLIQVETVLWQVLQKDQKYLKEPLDQMSRKDLFGRTAFFVDAINQLLKFSTTPRPFITVQMGRTLIFAWVLFLPFALVSEITSSENDKVDYDLEVTRWDLEVTRCLLMVFLVTYGYIGLTLSEVELHDPLGHDPNDLNVNRYTKLAIAAINSRLGVENNGRMEKLASSAFNNYSSLNTEDFKDYGSDNEKIERELDF